MTERTIPGDAIVEYWHYNNLSNECKERDINIKVLSMKGAVCVLPEFTGHGGVEIQAVTRKISSATKLTIDDILLKFINGLSEEFTHTVTGIISFLNITELKAQCDLFEENIHSHITDQWLDNAALLLDTYTLYVTHLRKFN